ncbi:MAG: hypothetical protein PW843_24100 [Azospirillaceae bacterium]|nr:hypothetical protein [Azospirillaceae bacterium]
MTCLLDQAINAVRVLPDAEQDELAQIILQLAGVDRLPIDLVIDEVAVLEVSHAQAERGEFATDEEIGAIWARHNE